MAYVSIAVWLPVMLAQLKLNRSSLLFIRYYIMENDDEPERKKQKFVSMKDDLNAGGLKQLVCCV